MGVRTITFAQTQKADTNRGPSDSIWSLCPVEELQQEPRLGYYLYDDFLSAGLSPATGSAANFLGDTPWYAYLDTNGAITDSGVEGGGIHLAAATTGGQGVALGKLTNGLRITDGTSVFQKLWFECRVQLSTASLAASKADVFLGLVDASGLPASAVPITGTGGSLATAAGFIGFHKRGGATNPGDFGFVYNVAAGTPVYATNLTTLVATVGGAALAGGTFVKLGFLFDPNPYPKVISSASTGQTAGNISRPMVTVFVNGQPAVAFLTSTNVLGTAFPTTFLSPSIAFKQQSTTAAVNCDVDWIRVAQLANS